MKGHFQKTIILFISIPLLFCGFKSTSQDILPPLIPWKGKSTELIVPGNHPWVTHAEQTGFQETPDYKLTMEWFSKLCKASNLMKEVVIGKSANNRDIVMIIASEEGAFDASALLRSSKPLLLAQAGIHAGEIDGKDAGMMLLRDIAFGRKRELLKGVNFLFIPILNVDGHERISAHNRVNQRGPTNMGWRTNARNLNLNRDYTKLDTEEIKAIVRVMNDYDPDLYLDLHVTDGADYQYDITFGYSDGYSPAIARWMSDHLSPAINNSLKENGHIPGPLVFATNNRDFAQGMVDYPYSARFSNNYGDLRHLPSILVENHSLKPFRQRVLGTYVFLEAAMTAMTQSGNELRKAIDADRKQTSHEVTLTWTLSDKPDTIVFLGIESMLQKSAVTDSNYVQWLGKSIKQKLIHTRFNKPDKEVVKPKTYWVPATYKNVIERLRNHGIQMSILKEQQEVNCSMYRIVNPKFSSQPFEGHFSVSSDVEVEQRKEIFYPGSAKIDTNQLLGDLVVYLLEPNSPDSFFQWNFFPEIFNRTEYIEEYVIEPLARKMLESNDQLRAEFEKKKQSDPLFVKNPQQVYEWFYERSPYVDDRYLLYPVGLSY